TNVIASHNSCDGKVSFWNGGKEVLWPAAGASGCAVWEAAICPEGGQQKQREQQREKARRLGERETRDQIAELTLRCRRVAQRGGQVAAENRADADAGATHADAGDARADVFPQGQNGSQIHFGSSSLIVTGPGFQWPG